MVKESVPNFFICPISLQLMKDPVTLVTGQTYDRRSIEKWFAEGHNTCPSTMQLLSSRDIAPNLTLQRLIQQWCTVNNYGCGAPAAVVVPGVSSANAAKRRPVMQIVQEVACGAGQLHNNLKELRGLVRDLNQGSHNRTVLAEAGIIPVLANLVFSPENLAKDLNACQEALEVLTFLPIQDIRKLVHIGTKQLTSISWFLNRGSIDGRVNAALLLSTLAHEDNEMKASVGNTSGIFEGLVQLLKEDLYLKAVASGLKAIFSLLSNGPEKNVIRAVEAGLVFAVVDRLLGTESRCQVQTLTKLMELLCSSRKGMEEVVAHALVVPLLARIIVNNTTRAAAESAVSCLWSICQHSPSKCVNEAAGQVGLLMQLTHVLESGDHQINIVHNERVAQLLQQLQDSLKNCTTTSY